MIPKQFKRFPCEESKKSVKRLDPFYPHTFQSVNVWLENEGRIVVTQNRKHLLIKRMLEDGFRQWLRVSIQ
jgi:NurA-like 5'-3' nuclease